MNLRFGLVGSGPWARLFYVPMLAHGSDVSLVAVWSLDEAELADVTTSCPGVSAARTFADLLAQVDAVAFAVPPAVQATLAPQAALAGKHLLLEKPIASNLADAARLVDAVESSGVVSQVMLTHRFRPHVRAALAAAAEATPHAAVATFVNGGSAPGGMFISPWRLEHGALLDVGPHVLDVLDSVVGPIEDITAVGDPREFVALTMRHIDGGVSQASLSTTSVGSTLPSSFAFLCREGTFVVSAARPPSERLTHEAVLAEFKQAVLAGRSSPQVDVRRGYYLQRLINAAQFGEKLRP